MYVYAIVESVCHPSMSDSNSKPSGWFRIDGRVVNEIAKDLNDALDEDSFIKALDSIALQLRVLVGAHQCAVSFIPDGDFSRAIHTTSLSDKYAKYRNYDVLPTGKGIWRLIFETCESLRLTEKELYSHPKFKHFSHLKTKTGLEHPPMPGWLASPVKRPNGDALGVLQLAGKYDGEFTKEDQINLENFASLIGASFEVQYASIELSKSKLNEAQLKKHLLELKLLHGVYQKVLQGENIEEAIKNCLTFIAKGIGWPIGHAYIPSHDGISLISSGQWYLSNIKKSAVFVEITKNTNLKKGEGLPGYIWEHEKPVWICDIYSDSRSPRAKKNGCSNFHRAIGFPIYADGVLIAIFEFYSYEIIEHNEHLLQIFQLLSENIGYLFEKKQAKIKLERLAHFDITTGLHNRQFFYDTLEQIIIRSQRGNKKFTLLFIDVDNFKVINDTFGHVVGDAALRLIAKTLKKVAREMDLIARASGDEFLIILEDTTSSAAAADFSTRLIREMNQKHILDGNDVAISVSIGRSSPKAAVNFNSPVPSFNSC